MTFYQCSVFEFDGKINSWIEDDDGKVIFDMGVTENFPPQYGNTPEYMTSYLRSINLIKESDQVIYHKGGT